MPKDRPLPPPQNLPATLDQVPDSLLYKGDLPTAEDMILEAVGERSSRWRDGPFAGLNEAELAEMIADLCDAGGVPKGRLQWRMGILTERIRTLMERKNG